MNLFTKQKKAHRHRKQTYSYQRGKKVERWINSEAGTNIYTLLYMGFPSGLAVKNLPAMQEMQETWVQSLGQEDPLEKEMVTQSSILAWKIPWMEKPTVHGVAKSWTRLRDFTFTLHGS